MSEVIKIQETNHGTLKLLYIISKRALQNQYEVIYETCNGQCHVTLKTFQYRWTALVYI